MLEGGLGPSHSGMRNITLRKVILCLTITVGVLWFLRPSKESLWSIKTPGEPLPAPPRHWRRGVGMNSYPFSVEATRANGHRP